MFRVIQVILAFSVLISGSDSASNNEIMAKKLPSVMKAVGLYKYLPITDPNSLVDLEVSLPVVQKNDVLIEVKATAVNPIDTKIRIRAPTPNAVSTAPRILGWDGSGVVVAKGDNTSLFNIGDEVFFIGDIKKNGTNAQYVALDEILVGQKPKNLTYEQAAAMPLTTLTAYEALFDRLLLSEKDKGKTLLVINSAGGVGSIATQLAKNLGLKVIGTASRLETEEFTRKHGAEVVLNHTKDLAEQLSSIGYNDGVDYILVNYDPFPYWDTLMKIVKAQGKICLVVDSSGLVDLRPLKAKSVTLVSEMLLTRLHFNTEDRIRYHEMLEEVSKLFESGKLKCTLTKTMNPINAANLKEAHRIMEGQKMLGKLVLSGF